MRKMNVTLSAVFCVTTFAWAGSALALNPQPEPPRPLTPNAKLHIQQVEPPDPCMASHSTMMDKRQSEHARTGQLNAAALACAHNGPNSGAHMLNPQPLPPG
ncbi:MAG: hypothetical protein WCA78_05500 [Rhizomicrobium sp.]